MGEAAITEDVPEWEGERRGVSKVKETSRKDQWCGRTKLLGAMSTAADSHGLVYTRVQNHETNFEL